MVYSFARIGAVIQMKVGDYFVQGRRRWVRSGTHALALTGAQLADAKSALDILGDRGTPTAAGKIYLRQLGPETGSIKLSDAIKEPLESKRRAGLCAIAPRQYTSLVTTFSLIRMSTS